MVLSMAVVCFVCALVTGWASSSEPVLDGDGPGARTIEVSCPGPFAGPSTATNGDEPGASAACEASRQRRSAGTWLALALSAMAGLTALALLHRNGPAPALDAPAEQRARGDGFAVSSVRLGDTARTGAPGRAPTSSRVA